MREEKEILLRGKVCAYLTCRLMGDPIISPLELRRLLYRKVGGLSTFENFVHVIHDAFVAIGDIRPVVHKPASVCGFASAVHRRQPSF